VCDEEGELQHGTSFLPQTWRHKSTRMSSAREGGSGGFSEEGSCDGRAVSMGRRRTTPPPRCGGGDSSPTPVDSAMLNSAALMLPLPPTRLLPYPSVGASSSPCGRAKNLDVAAFFLPRHMKLLSASHQSSASGIADIPFKHKLIMLRSQDSGMPTISTTIIA